MRHFFRRLTTLVLAAILLASPGMSAPVALAQDEDPVPQLMSQMSTAAKVGQLFLVTFPGDDADSQSAIAALIRDYQVGGVVLSPENGNIVNEGNTPLQVASLSWQLQQAAWDATQATTQTLPDGSPAAGPFVPLFIAVNHEGNGSPNTDVVNGMTPLPSAMALGATWNPSHAEAMGQIVGQELSALGINMLLGPSLDVLEEPQPESTGDLGVRTFGGDPFWVGRMGQMYISGVHSGSDGRVAAIAKHFPGMGASDRSVDEEPSTAQRTLDRLRQVDLAPFAAVAQAAEPLARPDGVVVSHMRFRGLEGGRFVTTRPVSVDSQLLQRLLALPEFAPWREGGGLTVSDGLGVRALQRFYDPNEATFNSRRIAQEAFYAGNDILQLSEFGRTDNWIDQIANVVSTITFFQEKYDTDPSFQTLVDASVARILRLKLSLVGESFSLEQVQPDLLRSGVQIGGHREAEAAVAREAITLLSPPTFDLVPAPPTPEDNILIFVDTREEQPCEACDPVPLLSLESLQDTIIRLYGPDTTGQIDPDLVSSFSFGALEAHLDALSLPDSAATLEEGEPITPTVASEVESALEQADWIVFAMLGPRGDPSPPGTVPRFLAEGAGLLRDPNLVVIAYDAPYYLDVTEISKLSAYYVTYAHTGVFVEASARALFGEFGPSGSSPVSIAGIGYDIVDQVSPNPNQTVTLEYTAGEALEEGEPTPTPAPTDGEATPEPPEIQAGSALRMRTSIIVDHNGNPVPDGTPVQFFFSYPQEGLEQSITAPSRDGVAEATLKLDRTGQLDIAVQSDPFPRTVVLQITIAVEGPAIIVPITPTPRPTPLPTPTATPVPSPSPEATPVPTPTSAPRPEAEPATPPTTSEDGGPGFLDLVLALGAAALVAAAGFYFSRLTEVPTAAALRAALICLIGGLAVYVGYLLYAPGVEWLRQRSGVWSSGWVALVGGLIPLVVIFAVPRFRGEVR